MRKLALTGWLRPIAFRATARSRYLPGLSFRPFNRPENRKRTRPGES
jgi:hypothetical protein